MYSQATEKINRFANPLDFWTFALPTYGHGVVVHFDYWYQSFPQNTLNSKNRDTYAGDIIQ